MDLLMETKKKPRQIAIDLGLSRTQVYEASRKIWNRLDEIIDHKSKHTKQETKRERIQKLKAKDKKELLDKIKGYIKKNGLKTLTVQGLKRYIA